MPIKPGRIIFYLIFLHIAFLILFVFVRYVDGDEGFYLSAAQQVSQGRLPYIDFFFPQMPYLPSVQSFAAGHGFATLYLTRLLGILPAVLALLLFVRIVTSMLSDRRAVLFAVMMYTCCGLILAWHSPAKTYAWTDLFLLIAYWGVVQFGRTQRQFWVVVSIVALALAINFRVVMAAAVIPLGYGMWQARKSIRLATLVSALAGAIIISAPSIVLFLTSPNRFMFDNLWFHTMRDSSLDLWSGIWQRVVTVGKLAINPQLWILVGAFVLTLRRRTISASSSSELGSYWRTTSGIAALFAFTLTIVYLLPVPIHQQYFVQAVPFVILASLPALRRIALSEQVFKRWSNAAVMRVGGIVYLLMLVPYLVYYPLAVREHVQPYRVANVSALCQYVREYPVSGPVYSEWAAVPVLSGREAIPGLEFVGFDYPLPISDSLKRYYLLPVNEELKVLLRDRVPALYVVWNAPDAPLQAVADSNYVVARRFDKFVVYERREDSGVTLR